MLRLITVIREAIGERHDQHRHQEHDMPAFHSASISTKLLQELGGATVIGPILVGLDRPVQIVPLSANDAQLVNMAALAAFNVSG